MTIGKKLYFGFGAILVLLVVQFALNFMAVRREQATRAALEATLEVAQKTGAVRFQMMQNRLFLRNYLLSGDGRELEKLRDGTFRLQQLFPTLSEAVPDEQKQIVANTVQVEQDWSEKFAGPLVEKRKQVDAGNATVAELQIFYLQQAPGSFISRSSGSLDGIEKLNKAEVERLAQNNKDAATATRASSVLSLLFGIGLAVGIAYYTHKSITRSLATLMVAAHQISEPGD